MFDNLTQEQLVERGVAAGLLLSDARFRSFFDEHKALLLTCISNTTPEDTQDRERLYFQLNGLRDLLGTMQSYSDAAEAIQQQKDTD